MQTLGTPQHLVTGFLLSAETMSLGDCPLYQTILKSLCGETGKNPDCHHVQKYVLDGPEAIWKKNLTNENILYKLMFVKSKGKKEGSV